MIKLTVQLTEFTPLVYPNWKQDIRVFCIDFLTQDAISITILSQLHFSDPQAKFGKNYQRDVLAPNVLQHDDKAHRAIDRVYWV